MSLSENSRALIFHEIERLAALSALTVITENWESIEKVNWDLLIKACAPRQDFLVGGVHYENEDIPQHLGFTPRINWFALEMACFKKDEVADFFQAFLDA